MLSLGIHGEWRSMCAPISPCSNSTGASSPHSSAYRRPGFRRFHPGVNVLVTYRTFSSYISSSAPSPCAFIRSRARASRYFRSRSQFTRSCQSSPTAPTLAIDSPVSFIENVRLYRADTQGHAALAASPEPPNRARQQPIPSRDRQGAVASRPAPPARTPPQPRPPTPGYTAHDGSTMRSLIVAGLVMASLWAGGTASIVDAVKKGDEAAVQALIQQKADVNAAEPDGTTALQWAAYSDDLKTVDLLLRSGAKVNAANDLGATPLWLASQNGSKPMVARLLNAGANPNAALLSGETPLMVAARGGYPEVVEQLLAKGANPNAHGTRGQTALMWAVSQQHPDVVKVLLAHHTDLSLKSDVYNEVMAIPPHGYLPYNKAIPHGGETALMFAARVGDLESAKLLVAAGANVKDEDAWGVSATVLAAHSGFTDLVLFLLDKGADPNAAPNGFTALHEAVMRRDEKMVASLLDHGANANAPLLQWTPTRRSSYDFHFEPSLVGATPFWLAARFDEPNIMQLLVKHGADPLFVFHASWVGEQGFGQQERKETSTALLAAVGIGGGNVSAWVPTERAAREALTLEAVKLAVEAGVDVNAKSEDGRTALDGANGLKYPSVVSYLVEKGAKAGTGATGRGGRGGRGAR